jgi:hypothetical protein
MKQNTKNILFIALFVLPILLLGWRVVYVRSHPWAGFSAEKISDDQLATATNPNYRKLEEDWLTNSFAQLFGATNIADEIEDLPIRFTDSVQSEVDSADLHSAINRVVQSLFAKTFEDYLADRSVGESLILDENSLAGQSTVLQRFYKVEHLPTISMDIHKMYWAKTTEDGKRATLWNAASWQASWIECYNTTNLGIFTSTMSFSESVKPKVPNCGIVAYASSFEYGPSPKDVLSKNGHIVTALAYLLVKTSEGKAYPLIVQFYWTPSIRTWLPTHLAVGYVGNRQFDPVF